jgi:hypothetical protein
VVVVVVAVATAAAAVGGGGRGSGGSRSTRAVSYFKGIQRPYLPASPAASRPWFQFQCQCPGALALGLARCLWASS